jgi:hypothetical protein
VGGVKFSSPDLLSKIASFAAPHEAVRDTRTLLGQQVLARTLQAPEEARFVRAVRAAIRGFLGDDNSDLEKFGLKPRRKPAPRTVDEKAAMVAKMKETLAKKHAPPAPPAK